MKTREEASHRPGSKSKWKLLRNTHFDPQIVINEPRTVLQRGSEGKGS